MKPLRSVVAIVGCGFLLPLLLASGCKKDEPPPPLPSAPPAASTAAAAPTTLELEPEPVPSASAEPKKTGGGIAGPSLKKCCDALAQNSKSAPPPNNTLMLQASQACNIAVAAGQGAPGVMAAVRAAMGGNQLPPGCQ